LKKIKKNKGREIQREIYLREEERVVKAVYLLGGEGEGELLVGLSKVPV
jgi:hypothetical protein